MAAHKRTHEDMQAELKSIKDDYQMKLSAAEAEAQQATKDAIAKAGGLRRRGAISDEEHEQSVRKQALLETEVASLQRRNAELESMAKQARIEKDKACELLNHATHAMDDCLGQMLASRTPGGLKASDVALNAEKFARGEGNVAFQLTSTSGSDVLTQLPQCRAEHVLLAWSNYIVEQATERSPKASHIARPFTDGLLYAAMVSHIFPKSNLGTSMVAIANPSERMLLFVREVSSLLSPVEEPPALATSPSMAMSPSAAFRARSPRHSDKEASAIVKNITALDLTEGREESHLLMHYLLFKKYANTRVIDCTAASNPPPSSTSPGPSSIGVAGSEVAVHAVAATQNIEYNSIAIILASRSMTSWRQLLEHVENGVLEILVKLSKGERASQLLVDSRQDAALARFQMDVCKEIVAGSTTPELQALMEEDPLLAEKKYASSALLSLVTNNPQREELVKVLQLQSEVFLLAFRHYAQKASELPFSAFEKLLVDCHIYDIAHCPFKKGSGMFIASKYAKMRPGNGLLPLEFVVALVHVAEEIVPAAMLSLNATQSNTLEGPAPPESQIECRTAARRMSYFLSRFVLGHLHLSSHDNVRRLLQDTSVVACLAQFRPALQVVFTVTAAKSAASGGKR